MVNHASRRITLLDAMVLVAATAGALTVARFGVSLPSHGGAGLAQYWIAPVRSRCTEVAAFLMAWTLALLFLRLAPPRRRWARLSRQPGTAGCYSTLVGFAFALLVFTGSAGEVARMQRAPGFRWDAWVYRSLLHHAVGTIPICIAMSWLTLRLSGRWKRDDDWIGVAGNLLGWSWLALYVAMVVPAF